MGVSPAAVKVNSARTKWGSCSGKKNLNFSWRLLMADDPVIDYVVVHELAHLTHMNHSADFWQGVEHILPNYHTHEHALITLQEQLRSENW
jgi:predicted metal-dependent hydrolase